MALLFLRNVVFPRTDASHTTSYSPVLESQEGSQFPLLPTSSLISLTNLSPFTAFTRRQSDGSSTSSSIDSLESSSDLEKGRPYNISPSITHSSDAPASTNSTFTNRLISDATIGLSDGLTVPFALTAGLSALGSSRVVVYGGLAELIAGAISMG